MTFVTCAGGYVLFSQGGRRMFQTPHEYLTALTPAYGGTQHPRFGKHPPNIHEVEVVFDFEALIRDFRNPELGGWGHSFAIYEGDDGAVSARQRKSSEVHHLHFYNHKGTCYQLCFSNLTCKVCAQFS